MPRDIKTDACSGQRTAARKDRGYLIQNVNGCSAGTSEEQNRNIYRKQQMERGASHNSRTFTG